MTQAFHQRNFNQRLQTMGDPSEHACDKVHGFRTHKLGLDRVWQNDVGLYMAQMTPAMRYTPDRMVIDRFIECMGIGRDKTLKLKQEKVLAMKAWTGIGPTDLFVFDQPNGSYYQSSVSAWTEACVMHAEVKVFPEGKAYYALHRDHFPADSIGIVPEDEVAS